MTTDPLIDTLVADLRPVSRPNIVRQMLLLLALASVELVGFLGLGTMRPDIGTALGRAAFWWKMAGLGTLALVGGSMAVRSFSPVSAPRNGLLRWGLVLAGIVVLGMTIPDPVAQNLLARLRWRMGVECLAVITILAIPPVIALGSMMRRGAPTDPRASAAAVGVAAAAWGAFIFAFHCPSDDPLYIVFWYALGCSLVTVIARALLPRISRW